MPDPRLVPETDKWTTEEWDEYDRGVQDGLNDAWDFHTPPPFPVNDSPYEFGYWEGIQMSYDGKDGQYV